LDVVSIATPPSLQEEIALAALTTGKAVFCEKPLALSVESAGRLTQAALKNGQANMIDFEFPEISAWKEAKRRLDIGELGILRHVAVSWNVETYTNRLELSSWKTSQEEGGGALFSFVSHVFYYLEWFLGPIRRIVCSLFKAPTDQRSGDTLAGLCVEMESGIPVVISMSSAAFLGNGHRVEFFGSQGSMVLDNSTSDYINGFRLLRGSRAQPSMQPVFLPEDQTALSNDGRIQVVTQLTKRLLTWIIEGIPTRPNLQDGLRVQRLLQAALRSHELGRWEQCSLGH
jgi:predicted dehydrogenase